VKGKGVVRQTNTSHCITSGDITTLSEQKVRCRCSPIFPLSPLSLSPSVSHIPLLRLGLSSLLSYSLMHTLARSLMVGDKMTRYVANCTNWRFRGRNGIINRRINAAAGSSLQK